VKGLTTKQQWTHEHITRCTCGAWVVLTEREMKALAQDDERPDFCKHLNTKQQRTKAA